MSVITLRPNAVGSTNPLSSIPDVYPNNWQNVDDITPDDFTTRVQNYMSSPTRTDLYNIQNHPFYIGGTINFIKVYVRTYGDETGPEERIQIRTYNHTYSSDKFFQQRSWVTKSHIWATNPYTGLAWTWAEIDALQIGIELDPPECYFWSYCTQVYVEIDYEAVPVVTHSATSAIEETTATGNGNITSTGDSEVTKRGICWNTTGNPTVADSKAEDVGSYGVGAFSKALTSLTPGTKYYTKAYAYNSEGYGYSEERNFTTKPNPPTVLACSVISSTQIDLSWTKGTGAEKTMVRRKVGSYPTSASDGDEAYFGTGSGFSDDEPVRCTHYYYRAWSYKTGAPNSGWSDEYSSDDDSTPAELATVTTQDATGILQNQVTGNGNITDTGGVDVTTRGFKYALTKDPLNDVHDDGTYGTGEYSKVIPDLQGNTEYWYCAYAVNSIGTSYGAWVKFQTPAEGTIPTGTLINICSDYSSFTYQLQRSETDDEEVYTGYFIINTDLAEKKGLTIYKRVLDLHLYFRCEASGTSEIYVKRDSEADFQYLGSVGLTDVTEPTIIIKHLAVDVKAKNYDFKVSFGNACRFLGVIFEFIPGGER